MSAETSDAYPIGTAPVKAEYACTAFVKVDKLTGADQIPDLSGRHTTRP